jgi:HEAT repeat protein
MGMMLKHEKTWTQEDVSRECEFLLQTAAATSETLQVRRLSIAALGDLKMKEAVPVVKALLAEKANLNRPEIARSASIALAELAPEEALQPIGQVLSETTNPAVFGSAAYALGRINSPDALPLLVRNRLRLGDNLSVDNAIEATSGTVTSVLKKPSDPNILSAIQATRSLWREEQKATYSPLLREILADKILPPDVRREALKRLMEDADALPLDARKEHISALLPLVKTEDIFSDQVARMRLILNAQILPITRIESQNEKETER